MVSSIPAHGRVNLDSVETGRAKLGSTEKERDILWNGQRNKENSILVY